MQVHVTVILTHHSTFETLSVVPDDHYKKVHSTYICSMTVAQNGQIYVHIEFLLC
jgi:hypothetical protein